MWICWRFGGLCHLWYKHGRDADIHHCSTWCLKWSKYLCSQNFLDTWKYSLFPLSPYCNIFHKFYMGSLIHPEKEVCDRRVIIDRCTFSFNTVSTTASSVVFFRCNVKVYSFVEKSMWRESSSVICSLKIVLSCLGEFKS